MKETGIPTSSKSLGHPLPLDEHACSVSLPTWSSIVGYEEGSPHIVNNLACGYPRFVYHPYIIQLIKKSLEIDKMLQQKNGIGGPETGESGWDCIVLPTRQSALRCHDFLVKACGYLDGHAASPRLSGCSLDVKRVVGTTRINLFSSDNAFDCRDDTESCYHPSNPIRVLDLQSQGAHAVIFPARTEFAIEAKSYWQHTGEVMSSRKAETVLLELGAWRSGSESEEIRRVTTCFYKNLEKEGREPDRKDWTFCPITNQPHKALYPANCDSDRVHFSENDPALDSSDGIRERIASITGISSSFVFLAPSGMAGIYAALRSTRRRHLLSTSRLEAHMTRGRSVVFGFPYLDTLKLCSRSEIVPDGVDFFGHGNENDLKHLEEMLEERKRKNGDAGISVLITEFPSNPLLNSPNVKTLRNLADEYNFALVIDDTIGNFANIDLISTGMADVVCTSLTKLFNGRGDAIAGSIIANPNTKVGRWIQQDLKSNHLNHEGLWPGDSYAIFQNSADFLERSSKINVIAEALADWLLEREEVAEVYYPKFRSTSIYNDFLRSDEDKKHISGYGGLITILLHPHVCQRTFYDNLDVAKGPSLGTNFTLVCPYTLLAHYHELDFAMSYDVQPNLLRIAVGLEDVEVLKQRFSSAFQESKLHPKLPEKAFHRRMDGNVSASRRYCTVGFPLNKQRMLPRGKFLSSSETFSFNKTQSTKFLPFTLSNKMTTMRMTGRVISSLLSKKRL